MTALLLVFGVTLYLAALLSGLARRTPVSTAAFFLVVGFVLGDSGLGFVRVSLDTPLVGQFAKLTLVTVLFLDGLQVDMYKLRESRRLPARALILGLPLTLLVSAIFAHFVAHLSWGEALLLGAVISPTDPVFASALVGESSISLELRRLLNIESGLNDGLALPIVIAMLTILHGGEPNILKSVAEVVLGVVVGVAIAYVAGRLQKLPVLRAAHSYKPILAVAIAFTVFAAAALLQVNEFLAMYAAAITLATTDPEVGKAFGPFGETVSELTKLLSLLLFGALLSLDFLINTSLLEYVFALIILVVARPVGLGLALLGSSLGRRERVVAVWFGPRGFASVLYGIYVLSAGVPQAGKLFRLSAVVIVASMLTHSSTDWLAARWLQRGDSADCADGEKSQGAHEYTEGRE